MKNFWILVFLGIFSILSFACSSTVEVRKPLPFDCEKKITLSKNIEKSTIGIPVEPTATFSAEDKEVIAYIKCSNLSGDHKLRWEWYDPNGKLYLSTGNYPFQAASGKYSKEASAWHRLSVNGEKAAYYPGDWQVKVFRDGDAFASKNFRIEGTPDLLLDVIKKVSPAPVDKNRWAMIIGIEKYRETTDALFAERDAKLMEMFFSKVYGVPKANIISLINEQATGTTLKDYIENKLHRIGTNDTLYFYYSGHGGPSINPDSPNEAVPYILPFDGNPSNLEGTGYSLNALYSNLDKLRAANIYVFLDTCFSGSTGRYAEKKAVIEGAKIVELKIKDPVLLSKKIVSFASSQGSQLSNSDQKNKHGLFTTQLVKGFIDPKSPIKSGNKITVEELYDYLRETVSNESRAIYGISREQLPDIKPFPFDERKDWVIWSK
ncbi:MAG: caspase family protein [Nitrospirae bacterium]|nr:caspase family protein [Nitrospirota bacterium]